MLRAFRLPIVALCVMMQNKEVYYRFFRRFVFLIICGGIPLKRFSCILAAAAAVVCLTTAASTAGSSSDPIISQSYITDRFIPGLISELEASSASRFGSVSTEVNGRLDSIRGTMSLRLGVPGYSFLPCFTPFSLADGGQASLLTGGTFILTDGSASLKTVSGTVINISTGEVVPNGSVLKQNQRYFCAEDTSASFISSGRSSCLADGYCRISGADIPAPPPVIPSFSDVPRGTWYYDAVNRCVEIGLFEGMGDGTFAPAQKMNAAQLIQVLYRMAGGETAESSPYWYSYALKWASSIGLVDEQSFVPTANITREYFIKMFYSCAEYIGTYNMTLRADITRAKDYGMISAGNRDAVSWAVATGIIIGTDADSLTIDPAVEVNRATVCQMIARYFS